MRKASCSGSYAALTLCSALLLLRSSQAMPPKYRLQEEPSAKGRALVGGDTSGPSALDAKRAENIAKREALRNERNAAASAARKEAGAGAARTEALKRQESEAARQSKLALESQRAEKIAAREAARAAKAAEEAAKPKAAKSKYAKSDVVLLKKIFDEYDKDGGGSIKLDELRAAMAEQKAQKSRVDGSKKTLAERQAEAGTSIADLVEPVFNELDKNGDGSVSFAELLRVLFPFASKEEFETMLSWVAKDAPKPPPKPKELSKEAQDELKAIFAAYDKDGNKVLSKGELKSAIGNIVDEDDIARMFKEADVDGSDTIDLKEFMEMMKTTGLWE